MHKIGCIFEFNKQMECNILTEKKSIEKRKNFNAPNIAKWRSSNYFYADVPLYVVYCQARTV